MSGPVISSDNRGVCEQPHQHHPAQSLCSREPSNMANDSGITEQLSEGSPEQTTLALGKKLLNNLPIYRKDCINTMSLVRYREIESVYGIKQTENISSIDILLCGIIVNYHDARNALKQRAQSGDTLAQMLEEEGEKKLTDKCLKQPDHPVDPYTLSRTFVYLRWTVAADTSFFPLMLRALICLAVEEQCGCASLQVANLVNTLPLNGHAWNGVYKLCEAGHDLTQLSQNPT